MFPRTAVEIQHEHEPAFVANPNVVTFYNKGQAYLRNAISADGDRCDWFGARIDIVRDVLAAFDPSVEARPETPFRITRGWADARTYLLQRGLFELVLAGGVAEPLAVEECVVGLLERVVRSAYSGSSPQRGRIGPKQREILRHAEHLLSTRLEERMTLPEIASEVGMSAYHLCRMFQRAIGTTLHDYRQRLRLRWSLESVVESPRRIVDIALESGFSSHSHFTSAFHGNLPELPRAFDPGLGIGHPFAILRAIF